MNKLIEIFSQRSFNEKRSIVIFFILLLILVIGSYITGIISKTAIASKRYEIAKSNYEYVEKSALTIVKSSKSESLRKDLDSIEARLIESAITTKVDYKYIRSEDEGLLVAFNTEDFSKANEFLKQASQILNLNLETIILVSTNNKKSIEAVFRYKN